MAADTEGNLEGFLAFKKNKESAQNSDDDATTTQDSDSDDTTATDDTIAQDDTEATGDDSTEDVQDEDTEGDDETESDKDKEEDTESAPGEDETEEDEEARLDPETVNELARAYADELLSTDELQKRIETAVTEQVERRAAEQQDNARAESQVAELIRQGEVAVNGMFGQLEAAKAEFGSLRTSSGSVRIDWTSRRTGETCRHS